jgi:hypothetical protein
MSWRRATSHSDRFKTLKAALEAYDLTSVADASGVCPATLYLWMAGITKAPRLSTMLAVADVIRYELVARPTVAELRLVGKLHR